MLKYIQIENFKSLKSFSKSLGKLNLFFGENSVGKSSVLQALLMLRQSVIENPTSNLNVLKLNGNLVNLGTVKDVISQNTDDDHIRFVLKFSQEELDVKYLYGPSPTSNTMKSESIIKVNDINDSLFKDCFFYLSADHVRPEKQYGMAQWQGGYDNIGIHGEYAVAFLARYGEDISVAPALCISGARSNKLIDQVSSWMARISPGARIGAEINEIEQTAKMFISYEGRRLISNKFSPGNVGFGVPYVFPVLIGLLASQSGGLLMIENPEAHLHPKAQSVLAELIAKTASNGTQIICESHSDHIINGIRVAVKEGIIDRDDVSIGYFQRNEELETDVCNIYVDDKGSLSDFPEGFLDEWGILMSHLL